MPAQDGDTLMGGSPLSFPTTIWSSVFDSPDRTSEKFKEKIERLLTRYWKPVYRTIRILWGKSNEDAKDLTQSFFVMILEDDLISRFCPEKGRFRTFLKAALNYYVADQEKARQRLKRGGGRAIISLNATAEDVDFEPEDRGRAPEEILDREWVDSLLEESINDLRRKLAAEGHEEWFKVYEAIDLSPSHEETSYRQVGKELKLSESEVTRFLHQARRRLRAILMERIGEYALTEEEVYEELNNLLGR